MAVRTSFRIGVDHAPTDFGDLNAKYRRPLFRYFRRRVEGHAEAEDLTHELFCQILGRRGAAPIEHMDRFIFRSAANLLRDRARSDFSRARNAHVSLTELRSDDARAAGVPVLIEDCSADRVLIGRERLAEVLACLDELRPIARDAFLLFRVEGMRQREIADSLGISVSAVEKHVMTAVAHLASRFGHLSADKSKK